MLLWAADRNMARWTAEPWNKHWYPYQQNSTRTIQFNTIPIQKKNASLYDCLRQSRLSAILPAQKDRNQNVTGRSAATGPLCDSIYNWQLQLYRNRIHKEGTVSTSAQTSLQFASELRYIKTGMTRQNVSVQKAKLSNNRQNLSEARSNPRKQGRLANVAISTLKSNVF